MGKTFKSGYLQNLIAYDASGNITLPGTLTINGNAVVATQSYVSTQLSSLVGSAPGALDTLNELSAALNNDANFSTTIVTSIATKEPAITAGTNLQYWRGDKTWQTLPIYTLSGLGGQAELNGTGFVKVTGTTVSYDNSTYLTTSSASSTYLPLAGGTLTGGLIGTTANFSGQITTTTSFYTAAISDTLGARTFGGNSFSIRNNVAEDFNIDIYNRTAGAWYNTLNLANNGGAATFSSSVTAGTTIGGKSLNISGTQSIFRIASNYTGGGDLLSGTLLYIDDVVNNNLTIIPSSAGTNGSKIVAAAYSGSGSAWRSMWEFANVSSGNPNLLLVKSGGNVGIGLTNPQSQLQINGTLTFSESGYDTARLHSISHAHSAGNNANNYVGINVSNGFGTTSERIRINGNGDVGINTNSPTDKLDVVGEVVFGPQTEKLSMGSASLGFNRKVATGLIYDSNRFAYQFQHTGSTSSGSDFLALQVYNTSGGTVTSRALVVNGVGNVGIGTTPTHLLSLYGSTQADIKFENAGAARAYIWSNSNELAFNSLTSNPIKFFINDTEMVRLRADGYVQYGPSANTLIYAAGNSGTMYMYQSGTARIYLEAAGSVIFNNTNGVMIGTTGSVGKLHVAGPIVISNPAQTWRRVLTVHGATGNFSEIKVIFNKSNWGSVTYDIKLASAGGSYHTAGAYYSNPGFSSHINSINAGNGPAMALTADSSTGNTQGAIWRFYGATMIHPSVTVDISCGNGYQIDPNDIIVQFL